MWRYSKVRNRWISRLFRSIGNTPGCLCGLRGYCQECLQFVIDTRCPKVWFLLKWTANVAHEVSRCVEQHKGKYEVIWLVQACQNLVLGDRDGLGSLHATFGLDETRQTRVRDSGLDVITEILVAYILWYETKSALGIHDGLHGATF